MKSDDYYLPVVNHNIVHQPGRLSEAGWKHIMRHVDHYVAQFPRLLKRDGRSYDRGAVSNEDIRTVIANDHPEWHIEFCSGELS